MKTLSEAIFLPMQNFMGPFVVVKPIAYRMSTLSIPLSGNCKACSRYECETVWDRDACIVPACKGLIEL